MTTDVVIIGAGPAGIFTALEMIKKGSKKKIVLVEKGKSVEERRCPKAITGKCMRAAIDETNRRREKQGAYNSEHGIVPKTIIKSVRDLLDISAQTEKSVRRENGVKLTDRERKEAIEKLEKQMREASKMLEFEIAAQLRDEIILLRGEKDK